MKTTLILLLAAGFCLRSLSLAAQTPPPPPKPSPAAADVKGAARVAPEGDVIIELKYDDMDLVDLIKSLALQAEINVLFDPKLTQVMRAPDGTVLPAPKVPAFRMTNVTARQALEAVLANSNLLMAHDPKTNTYRVSAKDNTALEPLVTRIIELKYTSPTNFVPLFAPGTGLLSARGKVVPDPRGRRLVISATEREWGLISEVIEKLDTPTLQVLIEARILESSRSPQSLKGVDWTGTLQNQGIAFGNGRLDGTSSTGRSGPASSITNTVTEALTAAIGGINLVPGFTANTRDGINPAVGFLNADGLRATLSFLNSDAETEVISTPRSVMMDGQTAKLQVTRAFPIFTVTPASANTGPTVTTTYTNLGTILEVSPRIVANSNIALKVIPEVSNIDSKDRQTIDGRINEANVYAIRRIETQVTIPSGSTLVMGGLITDNVSKTYTKVPILGDLPVLGWGFRKEAKTRNKANLLVFVTPTIIEENHFQTPSAASLQGQNQPTAADFLQQRAPVTQEPPESAIDSAKRQNLFNKPAAPAKP